MSLLDDSGPRKLRSSVHRGERGVGVGGWNEGVLCPMCDLIQVGHRSPRPARPQDRRGHRATVARRQLSLCVRDALAPLPLCDLQAIVSGTVR